MSPGLSLRSRANVGNATSITTFAIVFTGSSTKKYAR